MATANDIAAALPRYVPIRNQLWVETALTPAQRVQLVTLDEAITGLRNLADTLREDFERRADANIGGPAYVPVDDNRLGGIYATQGLLLAAAELAIERLYSEVRHG
ncbi:hypothetical protein JI752_018610 [Lysobacter sp. MMG2]|uniref:hypothetical protein n=1 Tax=Lysobacter sp. MMG2 TaxID=2801338 RepID=UPI001C2484AB|nr:hypothetical protein [Lysobacter sp. MMG2]MBU8978164.1 hypothetical protein [Lysobacter sp. MMG2]